MPGPEAAIELSPDIGDISGQYPLPRTQPPHNCLLPRAFPRFGELGMIRYSGYGQGSFNDCRHCPRFPVLWIFILLLGAMEKNERALIPTLNLACFSFSSLKNPWHILSYPLLSYPILLPPLTKFLAQLTTPSSSITSSYQHFLPFIGPQVPMTAPERSSGYASYLPSSVAPPSPTVVLGTKAHHAPHEHFLCCAMTNVNPAL